MTQKRSILAVNSIFLALASLAAIFSVLWVLAIVFLIEKRRVSRQSDSNPTPQKLTSLGG